MTFQILGPVRLCTDGREDPLGGTKQRTVLASLLLAEGGLVTDRYVSRMLWDTEPPATAAAQILTYASRLRARLGSRGVLERSGRGYRLFVDPAEVDHREFERLTGVGFAAQRAADHERAALYLHAALAQWHGTEALVDVTDQLAESDGLLLEERRTAVLEARIGTDLILGRHRQVIPELAVLVARDPLRESFRALHMTALYRAARQADAIALYQEGRLLLDRELGVVPGPLLARTYQGVLSGEPYRNHVGTALAAAS